ncbi:hypothetical protein KKE92_02860 [Candidatus Micrarchaeota archaeon]|nr:hypothetical protein [Candidatus Micrarchaeota archaeon]
MKGQLSAEMLILMVVILAIVALASVQLIGSAKETSENIGSQSKKLNNMINDEIKSPEGGFCFEDEDCQDGLGCTEKRCQ